ncbi:MAG: mismatch-specific DNA-glycosylase, partial [Chloroflexota bacterium]|nr:mismatch-specific DNA-glycosylase [Chloroflexota bacterium]
MWEPILRPGLDVVFVGFNPSLPAWRTGHYYANPGNRFYRLLHEVGLTPRLLCPTEDRSLPDFGIGAVDLLPVPTARADLVPAAEFRAAAPALLRRVADLAPLAVCCNGVGVHRHLFGVPPDRLGLQ